MGSEEGKGMGSGLLGGCSRGKKLAFGLSFVLGGEDRNVTKSLSRSEDCILTEISNLVLGRAA